MKSFLLARTEFTPGHPRGCTSPKVVSRSEIILKILKVTLKCCAKKTTPNDSSRHACHRVRKGVLVWFSPLFSEKQDTHPLFVSQEPNAFFGIPPPRQEMALMYYKWVTFETKSFFKVALLSFFLCLQFLYLVTVQVPPPRPESL